MKYRLALILTALSVLLFTITSCTTQKFRIISASCNNISEPLGISQNEVTFSWKMVSPKRNVMQTAYQIVVSEDGKKGKIWNSGKVASDQSILIHYAGPALKAGTSYFWKVRVWDNQGDESAWSTSNRFLTGLFTETDWSGAKWIGCDELDSSKRIVPGVHAPGSLPEWKNKPSGDHILPLLRKEFTVKPGLERALVFVCGLGQYELDLNGEKVGDHFMAPGWTHYDSLCFYNVYDVTADLKPGRNAFGIWLGNGFYIIPNTLYRKLITAYGNPKMILKMDLSYKDGSKETLTSDESWKTTASPVTFSSIFAGETFNAALEQDGWNKPEFDDTAWQPAKVMRRPGKRLEAEDDYPVKVMEQIDVKRILSTDSLDTQYLYDFGQNASGIVKIEVTGQKGDTIRLVPAELIDARGNPLQGATGEPFCLTYILKGSGTEIWSPWFTYYGFRYVGVKGAVPDTLSTPSFLPRILKMTLLHTRNSSPETGYFHTSEDLFNRISHLIRWAIKSNLQSVVTDCPHREKLGWLEQTHLMGNSIHYNFDICALYKKQIRDMRFAQFANGMIPTIAPEFTRFAGGFLDTPEWGSAGVILPWLVYQWYGDRKALEDAWPMMTRYVDYLKSKSKDHILDYGLGDWYDLGPDFPGYAQLTPVKLTATAIYYYDVKLIGEMARILGKEEDQKIYGDWAEEIKDAFNREFFNPQSRIYSTGSQTAISMPLVVGLVDEKYRKDVFQTLIESVQRSGKALTAGDVGFHFLVRALSDGGAGELLYEMNARDDVPGYGFQLKKGATTLTESWAALERVSNNHLMLGHLMEWFYAGLVGIEQTDSSVAFREVKIAPQMVKKVGEAGATFESPYGRIASHWKKTTEGYDLEVEIPANTAALVYLPFTEGKRLTESGKSLPEKWIAGNISNQIMVRIGSGKYHFTLQL